MIARAADDAFYLTVPEALRRLRAVEARMPSLPRFDESTLPARSPRAGDEAWRQQALGAIARWIVASNVCTVNATICLERVFHPTGGERVT